MIKKDFSCSSLHNLHTKHVKPYTIFTAFLSIDNSFGQLWAETSRFKKCNILTKWDEFLSFPSWIMKYTDQLK